MILLGILAGLLVLAYFTIVGRQATSPVLPVAQEPVIIETSIVSPEPEVESVDWEYLVSWDQSKTICMWDGHLGEEKCPSFIGRISKGTPVGVIKETISQYLITTGSQRGWVMKIGVSRNC